VNHTSFPKEDHLPDGARRDDKVTKGDRVECMTIPTIVLNGIFMFDLHSDFKNISLA